MKYANRIQETSTTTGTGPFTLTGADTNYQSFSSKFSVGDEVAYGIVSDSAWEIGIGNYSAANTLTRTTVLASSNAGSAVNFGSGSKKVFCTIPAELIPFAPLASDPVSPFVGQTWFNTVSGAWKGATIGTGTWTVRSSLDTAQNGGRGTGPTSGATFLNNSQRRVWNGSTFANVGFPPIASRTRMAVFGASSSLVSAAGNSSGAASNTGQSWDGSSWTTITASTQPADYTSGVGASSISGGKVGGFATPNIRAECEQWNGTAWSNFTAALPTATYMHACCGTLAALMKTGGSTVTTPTAITTVQTYNGTAWSTGTVMPTAHAEHGAVGTTLEAVVFGGFDAGGTTVGVTEFWNGTAWSTQSAGSARFLVAGMGDSGRSCFSVAGQNGSAVDTATVEQWALPLASVKTFTVA